MRTIHVVIDYSPFKAGDKVEVDDQFACDAIAHGAAVPCIDAIDKAFDPVVETRAVDGASEVK